MTTDAAARPPRRRPDKDGVARVSAGRVPSRAAPPHVQKAQLQITLPGRPSVATHCPAGGGVHTARRRHTKTGRSKNIRTALAGCSDDREQRQSLGERACQWPSAPAVPDTAAVSGSSQPRANGDGRYGTASHAGDSECKPERAAYRRDDSPAHVCNGDSENQQTPSSARQHLR